MTAVIGILNKRGVAIAADSAVTRRRFTNTSGSVTKCTKNGNKMIRLSDVQPVSVMITGNADYLLTPWEIIVRHYRQHRGKQSLPTVEAYAHDFFAYIAEHNLFDSEDYQREYVHAQLDKCWNWVINKADDFRTRDEDDSICDPETYLQNMRDVLEEAEKCVINEPLCRQMEDYTFEQFLAYGADIRESVILEMVYNDDDFSKENKITREMADQIAERVEHLVYMHLTHGLCNDDSATLIFTGYGSDQKYPALTACDVTEGMDSRVNYVIEPKNNIVISDECPVAFCPYAQKDVARSVVRGLHKTYGGEMGGDYYDLRRMLLADCEASELFTEDEMTEIRRIMGSINMKKLNDKLVERNVRVLDRNQQNWEKRLADADLQTLAGLADSLIDLTGFHRILHFQQEGVGGPVDLAVINRNDGFVWLRKKSWYHNKV